MERVAWLEDWAALAERWRMVPELDTLPAGFSHSLLFDVLIEIPKSCEAVCFSFLPKTWVWVWLGDQVGGGRLRAIEHGKA